ncbi:multidrug efflux RND transporter permease subunit [Neisseria sp. Ec49-e6-T10]|uniref:multidrug efflux RND transporter permease subunit n=1 Tax=Neisseria sp. Ec49-e6-T10 TaxID=3140744 RepID=UPI003EC05927
MGLIELFIRRPVATVLLTIGAVLVGVVGFSLMPVAPLPQVDYPTISVSASLPGASPETMASSVATPLERALGRIAGVTEMTSRSSRGSTQITLQFDLDRDINGAAREVQAAINASRSMLPSGMPGNPTYRKVNPADMPIMILALTSKTKMRSQMYDAASTILAQKIAQINGVGDVTVGGSSLPAIRVDINPLQLANYDVPLESVRQAINQANANRPKGAINSEDNRYQLMANDQADKPEDYLPLVIHYQNGAAVRLSDVATVYEGVEDIRNGGSFNGEPTILLMISRQPGANIIETVESIKAAMPALQASIDSDIDMNIMSDRSTTIRASLSEVEFTLVLSIILVILVVLAFLQDWRAALIPSIAVPVSLVSTFGAMYLLGFSLNNLSLMALTVATGFVVDDAIVVLENIMRHIEAGEKPFIAAINGAKEVGFTVMSMSISLIAVFLPILLLGGLVGRLFHEFALTLSIAILISLVVSLTLTPMLAARFARVKRVEDKGQKKSWCNFTYRWFLSLEVFYTDTLKWALNHRKLMMFLLMVTVISNIALYSVIQKGFFPQQDTGVLMGRVDADKASSFQALNQKVTELAKLVKEDPAVQSVGSNVSGRGSAFLYVNLKPLSERKVDAMTVINRISAKTNKIAGSQLFLMPAQDIRVGGRQSNSLYQYAVQADDVNELSEWEPKIRQALAALPELTDVSTDSKDGTPQVELVYDRDTIARLGLTVSQVDSALNNAFGQRQVATLYKSLNQYHVVMGLAPEWLESEEALKTIYLKGSDGTPTPLSAFSHWEYGNAPNTINHQGQFVTSTISFNLATGVALSDASAAVEKALASIGMPTTLHGSFQGTAKVFEATFATIPWLILAAILTIYIVLGILYESFIHPITILSTLPSAGVGAFLALMLCHTEFSIIALIGVLLLIGIVKKNAIMMIDFALVAEREQGMTPEEAIYKAAILRFRPIMMTTLAAALGALPLALGSGEGAEIRVPLGISIVGGLMLSQLLTLYTTPIVYLYLDRFRLWCASVYSDTKVRKIS